MKKNILVLTTFYDPFVGGAERAAQEITHRLGRDFNFLILTGLYDRSLPRYERRPEGAVYRLGAGFKYDKFLFPPLAVIKSFSLNFNLVYAFMASYAGLAALLLNFLLGKKYILSMQSGTLDAPSYKKIIWFIYPVYLAIHRRAEKIQAISNYLKDRAVKLGVAEEKIVVIPNGVDLQRFRVLNSKRAPHRIISVGRLEPIKGVGFLIKAMPQVLKTIPDAELVIVGDGSQRSFLKKMVGDLNLERRVFFKGMVIGDELVKIINSGTVFVCPSLAEGMGTVLLEAGACGLVIMGTKVGGIPNIIRNKFNGLLVDPENASSIATAIKLIIRNNHFSNQLMQNNQSLLKKYDWTNIAKEVDLLINNIISDV